MSAERFRWRFLPAGEHRFLCAFLVAQAATLTHFVHEAYAQAEPRIAPGTAVCFFGDCGTVRHAPEAYRVGVETIGTALLRLTHTQHPSIVAALLDFAFWLPALYLLSAVATPRAEANTPARRLLSLAFFLALAQFPLLWVVPWQRSETAPSALFVAATLCWVARARGRWLAALFVLALWQSLVRADVTIATGLGLAAWAALSPQADGWGKRSRLVTAGIAIAAIGAAVQAYLQFVRFPHLTYDPGTRPVQLLYNLRHAHQLEVAALALLPFLLIGALTRRARTNEPSLLPLALAMAAIYAPLWITFGVLQEVRVFVPFLLGLAATLAPVLTTRLFAEDAQPSARHGL